MDIEYLMSVSACLAAFRLSVLRVYLLCNKQLIVQKKLPNLSLL